MNAIAVLTLLLISQISEAFELIAHRGNARGAVENSIAGVNASWAIGVDAIELDVRVTNDGVVYLFHDDEIGEYKVADLSYAEMGALVPNNAIPTLASVLAVGNATGYYILDLKEPTLKYVEKYAHVIKNGPVPFEQVAIQSDDLEILTEIRKALPSCQYFYLDTLERKAPYYTPPKPEMLLTKLADTRIHGLSIKGRGFIDRSYIQLLQASGLRVYIWTINDAERAEHYRNIGADGIITDRAEALRRTINKTEQ